MIATLFAFALVLVLLRPIDAPAQGSGEWCQAHPNSGSCSTSVFLDPGAFGRAPRVQAADCDEDDLYVNMKWLMPNNLTATRGILAALDNGDSATIMAAFKFGQAHNQEVLRKIEACGPISATTVAVRWAETDLRLKDCGQAEPVRSATCGALRENLRWTMQDSNTCMPAARNAIIAGVRGGDPALVRRAVKYAQGHNLEVYRSVDYISDTLLLRIAADVIQQYGLRPLPGSHSLAANPFVSACARIPAEEMGDAFAAYR